MIIGYFNNFSKLSYKTGDYLMLSDEYSMKAEEQIGRRNFKAFVLMQIFAMAEKKHFLVFSLMRFIE